MATDITTLKKWFKTGLKPTQAQFWSWIDSYWHKDEKLPISNIENLENLLNSKASGNHSHSEYATNDATSLTDENTLEWQKKLKIDDLKFDDKSITVTQDYSDFGLQTGATINSFNNAIYQTVGNKLDAPVDEGTTENYPYVVGLNDDNDSVKLPAGDLGKNFANTDLVVSSKRKHTGTASVEFGMPLVFSNANQKFSAIPDKSTDATYSEILGGDSNGNLAKIGLTAITKAMTKSTDAQKDAWRNASLKTGETYSLGQPRVDSLLPPLLLGTNTSITLIGVNLFLNTTTTAAKVEIIDSRNNSVVEIITNISVHQTLPSKLMFNINRNLYVDKVFYYVRVTHNGLTSIINTNAAFILFGDFSNLSVDYKWKIKTFRSQLEPKTYSLELKNTSDFIFKNTGKNSEGNYENGVINIVSEKLLESSKTYIIQTIIKYSISNSANGEKMRFGIIPSNEIPTDDNVVTSLLGKGIMGGGYDLNRWIMIPISGSGRANSGEYCNLTLLIRNGLCLVIFKDVVYTLSLPSSMDGTYKLFFNITDSSQTYSEIEFVNTNFYQQ